MQHVVDYFTQKFIKITLCTLYTWVSCCYNVCLSVSELYIWRSLWFHQIM